jgi:hypothetical protein
MRAGLLMMIFAFAFVLAACDPKKPAEPKPPIPKVDFTHERSMS